MSFLKRLFGRDYEVSSPTQGADPAQAGQVSTTPRTGPSDPAQAAEPVRFVVEQTFTQTGREKRRSANSPVATSVKGIRCG